MYVRMLRRALFTHHFRKKSRHDQPDANPPGIIYKCVCQVPLRVSQRTRPLGRPPPLRRRRRRRLRRHPRRHVRLIPLPGRRESLQLRPLHREDRGGISEATL